MICRATAEQMNICSPASPIWSLEDNKYDHFKVEAVAFYKSAPVDLA